MRQRKKGNPWIPMFLFCCLLFIACSAEPSAEGETRLAPNGLHYPVGDTVQYENVEGTYIEYTAAKPRTITAVEAAVGLWPSSMCVSPDGDTVSFLSADGYLLKHDVTENTWEKQCIYEEPVNASLIMLADGRVGVIACLYENDPLTGDTVPTPQLWVLDGDGTVTSVAALSVDLQINRAFAIDDSRLCLLAEGRVIVYDIVDQKELYRSPASVFYEDLLPGFRLWDNRGSCYIFDPEQYQIKEENLPFDGKSDVSLIVSADGETLFYIRDRSVYRYYPQNYAAVCLFDLTESGVTLLDDSYLFVVNEDLIYASCSENGGDSMQLFRIGGEMELDRNVIVAAVIGSDGTIDKTIEDFNRTQSDYIIERKSYQTGNTIETALQNLEMDIIRGDGADLYIINSVYMERVQGYARKGLFLDLYSLAQPGDALHADNLLPCMKAAYETNGALYQCPTYVFYQTLAAKEETVEELTSHSLSAMLMYAESHNAAFTETLSYNPFYENLLNAAHEDILNMDSGNCHFIDSSFIDILNLLWDAPLISDGSDNILGYRNGDYCYYPLQIFAPSDILYMKHVFGQDAVVYPGYPNESGNGTVICPNGMFAAVSADADSVVYPILRQFLNQLFSYQNDTMLGLPVTKSGIHELCDEASQIYYYGSASYGLSSRSTPLENTNGYEAYRWTDADTNALLDFLSQTDFVQPLPPIVMDIVNEETSYFFGGVKTAEETAEVIQRRVQLYVDERQ